MFSDAFVPLILTVDVLRLRLARSELKLRLDLNSVKSERERRCVGGGRGGLCCHDTRCRIIGRSIRKLNCTFQAEASAPVYLPCCLDVMNNRPARFRRHLWRSAASSQMGLQPFTASFPPVSFSCCFKILIVSLSRFCDRLLGELVWI